MNKDRLKEQESRASEVLQKYRSMFDDYQVAIGYVCDNGRFIDEIGIAVFVTDDTDDYNLPSELEGVKISRVDIPGGFKKGG